MCGGAHEYVASFASKDDNGYFSSYGWDMIGNVPGIKETVDSETKLTSAVSTKYATKYDNKTTSEDGNSITYTVGKIGDGLKEVNQGGKSNLNAVEYYPNWFRAIQEIVNSDKPFVGRGGSSYSSRSLVGTFYLETNRGYDGNGFSYYSFCAILTP